MLDFEIQYSVAAELVELFRRGLEKCKVKPGEVVALFGDSNTNPQYLAGFTGAAKALGADVYQILVPAFPELKSDGEKGAVETEKAIINRGAFEAMKASDMVVNLATVRWLYTEENSKILESGTRIWLVKNPPNVLRRLIPCDEVKARGLAGAEVMEKGKIIRITSPAGTDLTFDKTGRPGKCQYGAADKAGRWDHWPGAAVSCAPLEGSCEGKLVIKTGDVVLRVPRYVSQPIVCSFENGAIKEIEGGLDAMLMKTYMEKFKDPKAFIPAHVGWGTEHRAQWQMLAEEGPGGHHDCEFFYGNILLGFGSNYSGEMGGNNVTKAHIDVCLRDCSLWVDDLQILDHGKILPEKLQ